MSPKPTPLPAYQLFIVYLMQCTEPLTATVIYPFVNQFVHDTGITNGDERKTGYYAGIIVRRSLIAIHLALRFLSQGSAFFLAEAVTVYHWGAASDRYGRRPILLLGPFGLALAMLFFGLSDKYWMLIVSRCIQGIFNGNIGARLHIVIDVTSLFTDSGVGKTVIAEVCYGTA